MAERYRRDSRPSQKHVQRRPASADYSRNRYEPQNTQQYDRGRYSDRISVRKKKSKLLPVLGIVLVCFLAFGIVFISPIGQEFFSVKKDSEEPATNFLFGDSAASFELNGDTDMTIMKNSYYLEEGTTAEEGSLEIEGSVDTTQPGTYTLTYVHNGESLTRTVRVIDDRQMVMNLNGSADTYVKQGQPYIESGCHVIDMNEGNLTSSVEVIGKVDTAAVGDYDILYNVKNGSGVYCIKKRTVHVVAGDAMEWNTAGLPVCMYHYVATAETFPLGDPYVANYILDTDLESHLAYLKENKFYYPSYQELYAYANGEIDLPAKSIILTFDDGELGFLNYGIPLFEKYEIPATSFIVAIDAGDKVSAYASEYISFQSHSYDMHRAGGNQGHGGLISAMTKDQIVQDLVASQEIVQNSEAFAYPFGDNTEDAHAAVREAGMLCAFTTEYGRATKGADPTHLPRVRINGGIGLDSFVSSVS